LDLTTSRQRRLQRLQLSQNTTSAVFEMTAAGPDTSYDDVTYTQLQQSWREISILMTTKLRHH